MPDEKRMLFVRNIESVKKSLAVSQTREYQVVADANLVGELTFGPYYFTIWEVSDKREGEERWLCLRVRELSPWADESWKTASESGFYHGGGVASELIALASLFLRRRLKLGPVVRIDDSPRLLSFRRMWIDKQIIVGHSNLADLQNWLVLVGGLKPEFHQPFILATKLYQQALELIETKPDLAYLNLISAIEVLAQDYKVDKPKLQDLDPKLATLMAQIQDGELRERIEETILAKERFIARKFVSFIVAHTDGPFWEDKGRPQRGCIEPSELRELMKRVYGQRSRTLHKGEPFPPSVFFPPIDGEEIDRSLGEYAGGRKWEPKDFIPHPHFFERLVNHVLKNFLKRNQIEYPL